MTNQGSMSPDAPGGVDGTIVYRPPIVTALTLMRFAQIVGINPIQFMSGNASGLFPSTGCTDKWQQYAWQDEHKASRDELAREIYQAELDIAAQLGYWPGQLWVEDDTVEYPKYHKRGWTTYSGRNVAGRYKSVHLKHGRFIAPGVRDVEYIGSALFTASSIVLVDEDGDGYEETAYVTVPTTYTSPYEHKVYFTGKDGAPEWEIRPVTTKEISGGVLTIRIPTQLLFKPELLAALPGDSGSVELDPADPDNLVDAVDVYYETPDPSQGSLFHWNESAFLVDDTEHTTQLAALEPKVVNRVKSEVTVTPASYNAVTGKYAVENFTVPREPDYVQLAYLSGAYTEDVRSGTHIVPDDLAQAITKVAVARLARPLCWTCETVKAKEKLWRTDLAFSAEGETGNIRFVTPEILRNPLGTKVGEVDAWSIIQARINVGDFAPQVAGF